jgi:hypothetical protein
VQIGNLAVHMQFHVGQGRDPIDQVPGHGLLDGRRTTRCRCLTCGAR